MDDAATVHDRFVNTILLTNNIYKKYPNSMISLQCFVCLFNILLMASQCKNNKELSDMFLMYHFVIYFYFSAI